MRLVISLFLCLLMVPLEASVIQVTNVRVWQNDTQSTRLVFDLTAPVEHNIFTLHTPDRLVIDLKDAELIRVPNTPTGHSLLKSIRSARRNDNDVRVVLDLRQPVQMNSFLLSPNGGYGYRLVVDIRSLGRALPAQNGASLKAASASQTLSRAARVNTAPVYSAAAAPVTPKYQTGKRDIIIAIDAGHGGIDPGASGKNGTHEKTVVLAIARELAKMVNQERGMRAVLVRNSDKYLKLRERIDIAREHKADLFISIHADAYEDKNARGASVYMLSRRGASSEVAKWLAEKENAADLVGGVSLNDKDDVLASVLLDLSQTGTLEASAHVGESVLNSLKQVGKAHHKKVQQAAFMVLRSPDIPSILIETAFISNPEEERKLNDATYRRRLANAILGGIRTYFDRYAPPGTLLAKQ